MTDTARTHEQGFPAYAEARWKSRGREVNAFRPDFRDVKDRFDEAECEKGVVTIRTGTLGRTFGRSRFCDAGLSEISSFSSKTSHPISVSWQYFMHYARQTYK